MAATQNIVLITADSIRADYCGFLNQEISTTPTLTEMADDGVVFTDAISPGPRTPSSIPEIMTGSGMPRDHVDPSDWEQRIARIREHMASTKSVSERLQSEGYSTIAFTSNPWTGTYSNFHKGFDIFQKTGKRSMHDFSLFEGTRFEPISDTLDRWWNGMIWRPINGIGSFARWPQFFDDIVSVVDEVDPPYFLWIFLLDTHSPYIVPRQDRHETSIWEMIFTQIRANSIFKDTGTGETSAYRNSLPPETIHRLQGMYRDSIRSVDRFVSSLWNSLEADDPLFIFHSDHGEAFNEHGTFGHQRSLYEENLHVPLLMFNSNSTGTVDELVSLRNLSDMVYQYSTSGVPFTDSRWQSDHAFVRTEDNSKFGLRTSRWKYILGGTDTELYDLHDDPAETKNVASENHKSTTELRSVLDNYIDELPHREGYFDQDVDSETETRLADLGYIE